MKSFKNHSLMLLALTVGLLDVQITKTVNFVEEPVIADKPSESKSFVDRIKESEFNRKLNERFDRLTNRFKKPAAEPVREKLSKPLLKVPELDFGEDPEKVTYGAEGLPDEEFPKPIDDSWDITTEEDKKLKLTDFEDKFEKRRSSWKNIFKSDSDLLEKYLTDPSARAERLEEPEVRTALAKLSRKQTAELFTKITQNEIQQMRSSNPAIKLSNEEVNQLYIDMFNKNEPLFKTLLKETDPTGKKQYILIPSKPADRQANSLVNFKFEILDISEYDPNLTIAENAERLKKSQDLSIRANRFNPESPTTDLATYIKNYLEDNPSPQSLKALLVDATDRTRKNGSQAKADEIETIFKIPGMKESFDALSSKEKDQFITSITKAELRLKETNMNLAGSGAKVSYEQAQRIFKENALMFEPFVGPDKILAPIESGSRNDISSFKFETIDISKYKNNIKAIFENQNKETPLFKAYKRQNPNSMLSPLDFDLIDVAKQLKSKQNLKLSIPGIVIELKNYIARQ
jgi:hypothetical protein